VLHQHAQSRTRQPSVSSAVCRRNAPAWCCVQVPLEPRVRATSDEGVPVVLSHPDSASAKAFVGAAAAVANKLSQQPSSMQGPSITMS
jgi:MinD-like ATPase involved in chromosome partitioning or flagellar assembly